MAENLYKHRAQYYETDQMKIVHHSNYIRWFEEARGWMLEEVGFGYDKMEKAGIIVPVLEAECQYKKMVCYNEQVFVIPKLIKFNGIKMTLTYEVKEVESGEIRAVGKTVHGFLNSDYKPMSLKRSNPNVYQMFMKLLEEDTRKSYEG